MEIIGKNSSSGGGTALKETSTKEFMMDVIQPSLKNTVLVDFWAPWCGPCKQLTPMLEKLGASTDKVTVVKLNIDNYPEIPGQLGIQSIPTVIAFRQGQPVDGFNGLISEAQLKAFVETVIGEPLDGAIAAQPIEAIWEIYETGNFQQAKELFTNLVAQDANAYEAKAGLALSHIALQETANAELVLNSIPEASRSQDKVARAFATLELIKEANALAKMNPAELQKAITSDASNHQARYDYSLLLFLQGQVEGAINLLLESITSDRKWNDEAARARLLKFFSILGHTHPITLSGRRKLSSILFS